MKRIIILVLLSYLSVNWTATTLLAQDTEQIGVFDYANPSDYEIGGVEVSGAKFSDENAIISIAGFRVGDKIRIPGGAIPKAIKALWRLRLFTDVQIYTNKIEGEVVFLEIAIQERPRLSRHSFTGIKKSYHDDLNKVLEQHLTKGGIVTDNIKVNSKESIEEFFIEKGYLDTEVSVLEYPDSTRANSVRLVFDVDRKERIKIQDIVFAGNENVQDRKLRKLLENTRRKKRLFASSKLIDEEYEADKNKLIAYYNTIGFRDAQVVKDSMWREEDGDIMLKIDLEEGNRYYFRNIAWKGNSIYETEALQEVLGINSGDVYNNELLQTRLQFSEEGRDISTLYMDNGYLFFQVEPIEVAIENDSIDLEIRIFEGPQATIDKVVINGNDRTHDHVIRRELRTKPGAKFSRSDIIRSQREIINLGYFNPETLNINTPVNPQRGTVDIEYTVEEKPSDQLELSAGWGGSYYGSGANIIGTLGVSFNNFSVRNIFNKEAWSPLPQGDGQKLSLRAQTNGDIYQSYNVSFTEPWLGGKKPTSFTISGFYNRLNYTYLSGTPLLQIWQGSVSVGSRLKWPDDNFVSSTAVNIQTLNLSNWSNIGRFPTDDGQIVSNGKFNNFSLTQTISRSSISDPIFPKSGSQITLTGQFTLPYSLFRKGDIDYAEMTPEEKYRWLEYHKWRLNAEWYTPLFDKFVLRVRGKIGILGAYNNDLGVSPFERFQLGGDGINNRQFGYTGVDIISLRGYEETDLEANLDPSGGSGVVPTSVFDKFTLELRYPISLNPSSTIYMLAFLEGGNAWRSIRSFNPFDIKRSAGLGLRVFLPMFGTLGFDYGLGFDKEGPTTFENWGTFNVILGFEPE